MNCKHLLAFYTVAKHKSFTLAARELNVSQPVLSIEVKKLEKTYNVILIRRNKKAFELTEEGKIAFTYAKQVFALLDDLKDVLIQGDEQNLKIGSTPYIVNYIMPDVLNGLKECQPDLKFQIYTGLSTEIMEMVVNGDCHVAVIGRVPYPDEIIYREIMKLPLYFITREAVNEKVFLRELAGFSFILPEKGSATRDHLIRGFKERNIPLEQFIECESPPAIKHMVHLGMGGAFFPLFDIRDDVARGKYKMVEILDPISVTYDLIYLKDKRKSRSVRSFVEVFKNFDFHSHPTRGIS
ncbi:MAG TPA: LysR family transcriptional regulator [Syntrophales bacterium]|nr:LysR family transcriptional regulator [Syntrophales bacterium]